MYFSNKKGHFNFVKSYKNNIKTLINNKKKEEDYLFLNKIIYKEKKKICFKNIFLPVCVINLSIFSFTLYNYIKKNDKNYFDKNDISVIDHCVMNDLISTLGVNNISIYLKNKLYDKLILNIQDEEYISKENSLLGLMETIYKNKKYFLQQKNKQTKIQNIINDKNGNINEEHKKHNDYYINKTNDDLNNNRNNQNITMNIDMYNKNKSNVNNPHYDHFIYFLFENIKKNNINHTKKKIISTILFYYIKYSDDDLYMSYDQILQLAYNPNLFYNLHNREEIISYLLLKILRNEKCTEEIYVNEKKFIHKYIQMKKEKKNHIERKQNYSTDIQNQEQNINITANTIIFFLLNHDAELNEKNATPMIHKINDEKKYIKVQNGKTHKSTNDINYNNYYNNKNYNGNNNNIGNNIVTKFSELPIYKFYKSFKKNQENYYKQQGLAQMQKYLNKINSTYVIEKNNNNNNLIVKEKYNNIMNKIYWKFFENTIFYTFIFSFVLHNINSKEYNIKTYLYMFKDIYKSIYTNVLINSSLLIQKSILNNINEEKQTNKFIFTTLTFNLFNSFILSLSIYKCKYAVVPLLFSQVVKDNYFL
ncbi:conserved Plasmodium protein, unknown function [Plasmodium sp. gorilla clade G3]|nr:conserved Plasmodium protein, unknown function [Plasmodium sp. gorilla clade G3]